MIGGEADQHLSEDQQVGFGRRFGELDAFPFGKPGENPYIVEIAHGPDSPGTEPPSGRPSQTPARCRPS